MPCYFDIFEKKVIRQGYVIDSSHLVGLYIGVPYMTSRCFRNKHNLITSFAKVMEVQHGIGDEPATAWFKLTNTGKSDLIVFVVDAENKL